MISLEQLLSSSVHLGHRIQQSNVKMKPFLYSERNGIHIIDLLQSLLFLKKISKFLEKAGLNNETREFLITF